MPLKLRNRSEGTRCRQQRRKLRRDLAAFIRHEKLCDRKAAEVSEAIEAR